MAGIGFTLALLVGCGAAVPSSGPPSIDSLVPSQAPGGSADATPSPSEAEPSTSSPAAPSPTAVGSAGGSPVVSEPPAREFEVQIASPQGIGFITLRVLDATLLVSAVERSERASRLSMSSSLAVANDGTDLRTILAALRLADCTGTADLTLDPLTQGIQVALHEAEDRGGCDASSVTYGVALRLSAPASTDDFVTRVERLEANHWAMQLPPLGGNPLSLVLKDETRLVEQVDTRPSVSAVPGPFGTLRLGRGASPREVQLVWLSPACEIEGSLTVEEMSNGGLTLQLVMVTAGDPGCDDLPGLVRRLNVTFERPISPDDIWPGLVFGTH